MEYKSIKSIIIAFSSRDVPIGDKLSRKVYGCTTQALHFEAQVWDNWIVPIRRAIQGQVGKW